MLIKSGTNDFQILKGNFYFLFSIKHFQFFYENVLLIYLLKLLNIHIVKATCHRFLPRLCFNSIQQIFMKSLLDARHFARWFTKTCAICSLRVKTVPDHPKAQEREMHWTWLFLITGVGTGSSASLCLSAVCAGTEQRLLDCVSSISNVCQPSFLAVITLIKHIHLK